MKRLPRPGSALALGVAIGTAVGVAMNNIAIGLTLGVSVGAALESRTWRGRRPPSDPDDGNGDPGTGGANGKKPPISTGDRPD